MATVALSVAGSAFGPIGTIVGGMVGSYIDGAWLFPAVFGSGRQDFTGPRLNGLQIQGIEEGAPMKYCLGPENRVAGQIIYASQPIERKRSTSGKAGSQTTYSYFFHLAIAWCEGPISRVEKIWADTKLIYDVYADNPDHRYESITHYTGSQTTANSLIQTDPRYNSADIPAFRGTAYTVIERFAARDFGNRIPNFTALIRAQSTLSVGQAIVKIGERAGRSSAEFSVSRLNGCFRGMVSNGPTESVKLIEAILIANNALVQENNGVLTFFHRGDQDQIAVNVNDLAAREHGTNEPRRLVVYNDPPTRELPTEVNVEFVDATNDYQPGSAKERLVGRNTGVVGDTIESMSTPVVMSPREARVLARQLLWTRHAERVRATLTLPPKYARVQEGDLLGVTIDGSTQAIRVSSISRGYNMVLNVQGVVQQDAVFTQTGTPDPADNEGGDPSDTPIELDWLIFDIAPLTAAAASVAGVYWGASRLFPEDLFIGAVMLDGATETGTFNEVSPIVEAVVGRTLTKLPAGRVDTWDRASTVDIQLNVTADLATVTEAEALNGLNTFVIGREIVVARTVTLLSPNTYRLSNLLRGRRGTEDFVPVHYVGDPVMLLDSAVGFTTLDLSQIGRTRWAKAVSLGDDEATVDPKPYFVGGRTLKPFGLVIYHVLRRNSSTNQRIDLYWHFRSRYPFTNLSVDPPILGDEALQVRIEIWNKTTNTWVLITTTAAGVRTHGFTSSTWTTNGYTVDEQIPLRLAQVSNSVELGPWIYVQIGPADNFELVVSEPYNLFITTDVSQMTLP